MEKNGLLLNLDTIQQFALQSHITTNMLRQGHVFASQDSTNILCKALLFDEAKTKPGIRVPNSYSSPYYFHYYAKVKYLMNLKQLVSHTASHTAM